MSLQNAAIITNCSRWPLIIDPQLQGTNWLKGLYQQLVEQEEKDKANRSQIDFGAANDDEENQSSLNELLMFSINDKKALS